LVCAFATAEYFPVPGVPAFRADLLPEIQPIQTMEEAIAYTQQIAKFPYIQWDASGAAWTADEFPEAGEAFRVRGRKEDGNYLIVVLLKEGGIYSIVQTSPISWATAKEEKKNAPWEPELIKFAAQYITAANPALEGKLNLETITVHHITDTEHPGALFAMVDISYTEKVNNSWGTIVVVQLAPELRIFECSPGNG